MRRRRAKNSEGSHGHVAIVGPPQVRMSLAPLLVQVESWVGKIIDDDPCGLGGGSRRDYVLDYVYEPSFKDLKLYLHTMLQLNCTHTIISSHTGTSMTGTAVQLHSAVLQLYTLSDCPAHRRHQRAQRMHCSCMQFQRLHYQCGRRTAVCRSRLQEQLCCTESVPRSRCFPRQPHQ